MGGLLNGDVERHAHDEVGGAIKERRARGSPRACRRRVGSSEPEARAWCVIYTTWRHGTRAWKWSGGVGAKRMELAARA